MAIYRELLDQRAGLAPRFVLVTGDMMGARGEVEALPVHLRPQILEKPFSTFDVRGVLAAITLPGHSRQVTETAKLVDLKRPSIERGLTDGGSNVR
jgi:hypothetical protein